MLSVWVLMIRVWNWGHLKQHVFDLWKKNKYFSHFQKLFPPIRARGHTFYPVFLVWTLPITSSTQWISGITDHHITVDKELQDINRGCCDWYLQISVDFHICVFIAEVTCWLRFSWSSAKANIWTSKRLKWEGYLTLASAHTGWKITWYGSTGFTQLKGIIFLTIIFCLIGQYVHSDAHVLVPIAQVWQWLRSHPLMMRFHLGWDILSSSSVAQQFSSSSDTLGFVDHISSTSKYTGCCRYFGMG